MTRHPLLRVADLTVTYGGVTAVDRIGLQIDHPVVLGIIGPNGSGKTSLINAISCFTRAASGSLSLAGADYAGRTPDHIARLGIARTFQSIRLVPGMSVLESVMLGADSAAGRRFGWDWWTTGRRARATERDAQQRAYAALERVEIAQYAKRIASTLSYGAQRRVEIARALAAEPTLLLLDEPTAGMQERERWGISELIKGLVAENIACIVIEHNLRMMRQVSDRLMVLDRGKLLASGEPADVLADPTVQAAYIGHTV